jgi:hypothetical protein
MGNCGPDARHHSDGVARLKLRPSEWMPWNYRDTLEYLATPAAA